MSCYKSKTTFEQRKIESDKILGKYPERVPIILEKLENKNDYIIPDIDKNKYLVPNDLTVGQLIYVIRKRLKCSPEKALFIFCGGVVLQCNQLISEIYSQKKDEDGFLYMIYSGEATFG